MQSGEEESHSLIDQRAALYVFMCLLLLALHNLLYSTHPGAGTTERVEAE